MSGGVVPGGPAPLCGRRGGRGRRKRHLAASAHWSRSSRVCGRDGQRHPDTSYTGWGRVWETEEGITDVLNLSCFASFLQFGQSKLNLSKQN